MRMGGALPPPGFEWMIGKTAQVTRFVNAAQTWIDQKKGSREDRRCLEAAIAAAKEGSLILDTWTTPEEYLENQKS